MLALRKFLVALLAMLHRFLVLVLISLVAFVWQFGDRQYVVDTLDTVGFHEKLVPSLIKANEDQSFTEDGSLPLSDPEVSAIFTGAFPPETISEISSTVIDAVYDYAEGTQESLTFTIDITQNEQLLRENITTFAVNRLAGLPQCTNEVAFVDPLTTDCRPPGIVIENERAKIAQTIRDSDPVIEDTIISSEDLLPEDTPIERVPDIIGWAKQAPYIIAGLLLVLSVAIMLLSSTKKRGFRRIVKTYLSVTSSLVLLTVIFGFVVPALFSENPLFQTGSQDLNGLVNSIADQMSRDYSWRLFVLSTPILVVGLLLWLKIGRDEGKAQVKRARRKQKKQFTEHRKHNKTASKAPIQASSTPKRAKPKSKKKSKYAAVDKRGVE